MPIAYRLVVIIGAIRLAKVDATARLGAAVAGSHSRKLLLAELRRRSAYPEILRFNSNYESTL